MANAERHFHIVGLGVSNPASLDARAERAIINADVVIGSPRQLQTIEILINSASQQCIALPPFSQLKGVLDCFAPEQRSIVILASGDPLYYGIGRWFYLRYLSSQITSYPNISSIQAACHLTGQVLQAVEVVSLHGRPLATLRRHLHNNKTLVVLTDKNSQPRHLALACQQAGLMQSRISVCEDIGYDSQRVRQFTIEELISGNDEFSTLHVSVMVLQVSSNTDEGKSKPLQPVFRYPTFPGISDSDFITNSENGKGMLTKREVRLQILSLIQPAIKDIIWDIGAGCGGVSVELSYWQPRANIIAIEHHADRLNCLNQNIAHFGVLDNVQVVEGYAPDCLADLPKPNKIFIGGSDGQLSNLLALCWDELPAGGVLVASAVTEPTKQILLAFYQQCQTQNVKVSSLQIAVSRAETLAGQMFYKPQLPVSLFYFAKAN